MLLIKIHNLQTWHPIMGIFPCLEQRWNRIMWYDVRAQIMCWNLFISLNINMGTFLSLDDLPCKISILLILNMGIFPCLEAWCGHIWNTTRSYMAFTVQKRELTLENPFLYWKGFVVKCCYFICQTDVPQMATRNVPIRCTPPYQSPLCNFNGSVFLSGSQWCIRKV